MTTRNRQISVLLANANVMTSRLLSRALEKNPEFRVVGCVAELNNLVQEMERLSPDVLLVTTQILDASDNRFAALQSVTTAFPDIPCILLLNRSDAQTVVDAFRAGVKGIFSCADGETELLEKCIRRVVEGQIWADTAQMHFIISALPQLRVPQARPRKAPNHLLTAREEQVVSLVTQGMGNREIAAEMQLSENTVKNYLFRIFEKLGFSNRVELALYATSRPHASGESEGVAGVDGTESQTCTASI
jgi:DNA-binding NarL/FixJ family response regulator